MFKKILTAATIFLVVMSASMMLNLTTFATTTKPIELKIYVSPSSILADNNTYTCIFVQLLNADGNPARAEQDTIIDLSSSAPGIGIVDLTTTIPKNFTYASANFTSTYLPGTTTITATAPNYSTVASTLTTIGPYPYKTTVYGFPSVLPADGGTYDAVMVQLQDSNGLPARAPNDVQVSLFCSDNSVGSVTPSITILQGQTFAIANFTTTTAPGDTYITAVGHGYVSTQETFATSFLSSPEQLYIFEGPPQVLADNGEYRQIAIELQDSSGIPATRLSNTTVTIASSDNNIATTDNEITIPAGSTYAVASIYTTYRAGEVTITAATNGLNIDRRTLTTVGYTPSKLAVFCAPSNLPADNLTYSTVQVQLQDAQGRPARNPDSGTILKLFSSDLSVGDVFSPITIPLGQTQANSNFSLTLTPGSSSITAIASNYTTGQVTIASYFIDYRSMQVTLTLKPDQVNGGDPLHVSAYLLGESNPVNDAKVTFTSDIGGTFAAVQEGNGYYNTTFTTPISSQTVICTITVNASKTGWLDCASTSQVTVVSVVSPTTAPTETPVSTVTPTPSPSPTVTSSPASSTVNPSSPGTGIAILQLWVKNSDGLSLSGINVKSTSQPEDSPALSAKTNATGFVTFQNVKVGSYTFQISSEGYEKVNHTFDATNKQLTHTIFLNTANSESTEQNSVSSPFLVPAVMAIIIVVAVVSIVLFVRRHWSIRLSL